ncbi:hypothetical protein OHV05_35645 (plasmid) [Kitasatospora sp. NBC_00070]|uniref:hypothetical protein n=1 Tax=Kitasatospora sp. NBC_00070 TaxID=2975962 RepID=UPI002F90F8EB
MRTVHKDEAKLVAGLADSLVGAYGVLRGRAQGVKHTGQGDITGVRPLPMSAESLLRILFLT